MNNFIGLLVPVDEAAGIVPPFFPHHHHPVMVPPVIPLPTPNISLPMPPLLPPPPLPQQFGSSQQSNLGELLMTTNALPELIQKVHDLGFPGSCQFVLGLLERSDNMFVFIATPPKLVCVSHGLLQ